MPERERVETKNSKGTGIISIIQSKEFKEKVEKVGGYTLNDIGKVTIIKC